MRIAQNTVRSLFIPLALTAALFGCGGDKQAAGPAQAPEPEVSIATIAPQQVTLTTVLAGRTSAYQISEVRPQVGGIVQKRTFKEGGDVKVGEVLYQIDPATYQAAYDNAKATLAKAEANAVPARLKGKRYANLSKVNAVSQQDNDDAQAAMNQAEAEVVAARAALETARINLSYTRVTSPITGRIGKSNVTPGALVTASQADPLTTVQQTDPMYVDVTQSSAEVLRLKRDLASGKLKKSGTNGAKVKLLFEDGTPYPLEGSLQFSDITVDQSTGVITLRALFPNPQQDLLPGLYVRAVLEEGVEENAVLVPQQAVTRDSKGNALVMALKQDNTVEARSITVSRVVGDKWLVSEGLAAGDRIIVEGLQKAKPGSKVKPVEAGSAQPAPKDSPQADAAGAKQPGQPEAAKTTAPAKDAKPEAKPAAKPEAKPAAKAEAKPAAKPEAKPAAQAAPSQAAPGATKAVSGKDAMKETMREVMADEPKTKTTASANRTLVYSPPKDQPWPGSTGPGTSVKSGDSTANHQ